MSQNKRILESLQNGDKLTPLDALERFGCFRLGARVYDLRKQGHDIKSETVARKNSNGEVKRYSQYFM